MPLFILLNTSAHVIILTFYESGDNRSFNLCTLRWSLLSLMACLTKTFASKRKPVNHKLEPTSL